MHPQTLPAYHVLESEGLRYQGYVDIFDAGPTIEANIDELRAVKESQLLNVKITSEAAVGKTQYLIANDNYHDYKAMLLKLDLVDNTINLTHEQAEKLGVQEGHVVRVLSLNQWKYPDVKLFIYKRCLVTRQRRNIEKTNPVDNQTVWSGAEATATDVEQACQAARIAFPAWARLPLAERVAIVEKFAALLEENKSI